MPLYKVKAYFTSETVAIIESEDEDAALNLDGDIGVQMEFGPYLDDVEILEELHDDD